LIQTSPGKFAAKALNFSLSFAPGAAEPWLIDRGSPRRPSDPRRKRACTHPHECRAKPISLFLTITILSSSQCTYRENHCLHKWNAAAAIKGMGARSRFAQRHSTIL
jgi:hypothetical protein